jgi:hypothetical protein
MKVIVIKKNKEEVYRKLSKLIHKKAINPNSKVESLKGVDLFKQVIALEGSTLSIILENEEL